MSSSDNLQPIVAAAGLLGEQIKELQDKKKVLDNEIKEAIADRGLMVFGDYAAEVKSIAGRRTLDAKLLAEEVRDIERFYKVGAPSLRLTIKRVG